MSTNLATVATKPGHARITDASALGAARYSNTMSFPVSADFQSPPSCMLLRTQVDFPANFLLNRLRRFCVRASDVCTLCGRDNLPRGIND